MNERIKIIRKDFGLTQDEFGKKIGSARNTIANYENGNRTPSNSVILSICREFNVNEKWIREGLEPKYIEKSRSDIIAEFAGKLMKDEDASFRRRLTEALAKLDESEWELLEKIAQSATKKD